MGSFNSKCAISGLSICAGDEVKLVLIRPGRYSSKGEYAAATEQWDIMSLPIDGVYNDYGGIESVDEETPERNLLRNFIVKHAVETGVGENQIHDVPLHHDMTLDELLEAAWEDTLRFITEPEMVSNAAIPKAVRHIASILGDGYLVSEHENGMRVRISRYTGKSGTVEEATKILQDNNVSFVVESDNSSYGFGEPQILIQDPSCKRDLSDAFPVKYVLILKAVWDMMVRDCVKVPEIVQHAFDKVVDVIEDGDLVDSEWSALEQEGSVRLFSYEKRNTQGHRVFRKEIVQLDHPTLKRAKADLWYPSRDMVASMFHFGHSLRHASSFAICHKFQGLSRIMAETSLVVRRMTDLKIVVTPTPLCGQETDLKRYIKFHTNVLKIAKAMQKDRKY